MARRQRSSRIRRNRILGIVGAASVLIACSPTGADIGSAEQLQIGPAAALPIAKPQPLPDAWLSGEACADPQFGHQLVGANGTGLCVGVHDVSPGVPALAFAVDGVRVVGFTRPRCTATDPRQIPLTVVRNGLHDGRMLIAGTVGSDVHLIVVAGDKGSREVYVEPFFVDGLSTSHLRHFAAIIQTRNADIPVTPLTPSGEARGTSLDGLSCDE